MEPVRLYHEDNGYHTVYNKADLKAHLDIGWKIDVPVVKAVKVEKAKAVIQHKPEFKIEKAVKLDGNI